MEAIVMVPSKMMAINEDMLVSRSKHSNDHVKPPGKNPYMFQIIAISRVREKFIYLPSSFGPYPH